MHYTPSLMAIVIFAVLVGIVLGLTFFLGGRAKSSPTSSPGYNGARGQVPWFVNGVAFAGDYLSAASFLGICGLIAFYGYDGFLYSIGLLAGWVVALLLIAEPIRRLGKFTLAEALDSRFDSRSVKVTAAISTLIVSLFFLTPEMVGAGALIKPLLGIDDVHIGPVVVSSFSLGVMGVGAIVIFMVTVAGRVATTWGQFIKGGMLVIFCLIITLLLLGRGLTPKPADAFPRRLDNKQFTAQIAANGTYVPMGDAWFKLKNTYFRMQMKDGSTSTWILEGQSRIPPNLELPNQTFTECETRYEKDGVWYVNGLPLSEANNFRAVNFVKGLPPEVKPGRPLGPLAFLTAFQGSTVAAIGKEIVADNGVNVEIYFPRFQAGSDLLAPGGHPTLFAGLKAGKTTDRLNFLSLMLALFCGAAALPHILIRYYTVKDQAAARKSAVVGVATIGLFYILMLYLGLGAMTAGQLDPTDSNVAAPLLMKAFGGPAFAIFAAIAFTIVLGTVSELIVAASGTIAHDLLHNVFKLNLGDRAKVRAGKISAVAVGLIAICLGILFRTMNVAFLLGWAFNVAASANLPAITMRLFWKRTTKQGIAASIVVGLVSSLIWIFLSGDAYAHLYDLPASRAPMPFNQPALVTIPLSYIILIFVSLVTYRPAAAGIPEQEGQRR